MNSWESRFAEKREAREGLHLMSRIKMRLESWEDFKTLKTISKADGLVWERMADACSATEEAN